MKCGRIKRWMMRNGGDELPSGWRDHVAACEECQTFVAQMRAMDSAIGDGDAPDPGDAYWEGFAPSVARRIDELSRSRRPAAVTGRPVWLKTWVPAIGAAALALLIARELVTDPRPRPVMENDVPVAVKEPQVQPQASDNSPETAAAAATEKNAPAFRHAPSLAADNQQQASNDEATRATHNALERTELPAPAGAEGQTASGGDVSPAPELSNAETAISSSADDARVWPDRRVTKMGEVDSDQMRQTLDAQSDLSELGTPTLADNALGLSAAGAETSATLPMMGRLEAPRTYRASRVPDSQSPMDAMRRFDELRELREQIGTLSAINPADRTPEQNRELCAIWYRMGTITDNSLVLDSAIQQLDHCLQTLDVPDSDEWLVKSEQLTARRALFDDK